MDPTANIEEQLSLAEQLLNEDQSDDLPDAAAYRLAELVVALDEWISKGGFLPRRWARRP